MAKIYREVEDIQEPTPRPVVDMKQQPSAEPFDSQRAHEALSGRVDDIGGKVEQMGNDVTDFKKKFDERFGAEQTEPGMEEPLEGEESTDPMDNEGEDISDVNNTTSAAPQQKNFEKFSKRKTIVGGRTSKQQFDVKQGVKEFLKGYGGVF